MAGKKVALNWSQLVPFFVAISIFFPLYCLHMNEYITIPMKIFWVLKCFPIYSLIRFVCKQFYSFNGLRNDTFSFLIVVGLALSSVGDIFLQDGKNRNNDSFFLGLLAFLLAHICYIQAFKWTPLKPGLFFLLLFLVIIETNLLFGGDVLAKYPPTLSIGVYVYTAVIGIMLWRSWARVNFGQLLAGHWQPLCGAVGAIFFVVSDTIIAVSKFRSRFPGSGFLIMTTYYAAQLAIALTVTRRVN
uniref:lysoplasmalogenase n=1 Tax=Ciona intestinalis TaxID=7719 RepID=H2XTR6_CIOIN|nr:lysoplasmalogenase-like protein TMEM86A [Ciona intestinalis]|eukprot:XP_004226556.1 lysoplasmalogenase-like protein TMEM86A [Ciona intestinalis]